LLWEQQQRFRLEVIVHLRSVGQTMRKKAVVFRQKEHSISIPFICIRCSRRRRRISLLFVAFFFRRFAEEFVVLKMYSAHQKSAREALDTPPREAGIPSLARETHRLITFARGFFGEEDKETGSFKRERHIPTRIKSEKIIRVGHFLARKYLLSVRPRGPRTSRQQAQCIKKYISIPKKNLEKDLYVRACARASKKTKTKRTHI
jgi:hypothetical protein